MEIKTSDSECNKTEEQNPLIAISEEDNTVVTKGRYTIEWQNVLISRASDMDVHELEYNNCNFVLFDIIDNRYFPFNLNRLTFYKCNLSNIFALTLKNLEYLNVNSNKIKSLIIRECVSLKTLYASDNLIEYYSLPINIEKVDLANNNIEMFKHDCVYPNLFSLNLNHNDLERAFCDFSCCPVLTNIDLSNNNVESWYNLPLTLNKLYIDNGKLTTIPYLINCTIMILDNCEIRAIPEYITQLVNLLELSLDNNKVVIVYSFPPNLKHLSIASNELKYVTNLPASMCSLNISNNSELIIIPILNEGLTDLDISNTGIKRICFDTVPLTLRSLSTENTKLTKENIAEISLKVPGLTIVSNLSDTSDCPSVDIFGDLGETNYYNSGDEYDELEKIEKYGERVDMYSDDKPEYVTPHRHNIVTYDNGKFVKKPYPSDVDSLFPPTSYRYRHYKPPPPKPEWAREVFSNPYYLCNTYDV